jgi:ATP-dependent protease Clp ATPase subunit
MFELPELENVVKVTVDKSSVLGNTDPVITYGKKQSTSAA